jgi:serine protease AprX
MRLALERLPIDRHQQRAWIYATRALAPSPSRIASGGQNMPNYYIKFGSKDKVDRFLESKFYSPDDVFLEAEIASDAGTAPMPEISRQFVYHSTTDPYLVIAELTDEEVEALRGEGAEVSPTLIYHETTGFDLDYLSPLGVTTSKGLPDVLVQIKADKAHLKSRGRGVHIAIVDTGICGTRPEFPLWKQSPLSLGFNEPWEAPFRHGSMLACIAAATKAEGGIYDGVAPDATLISCPIPGENHYDEAHLIPIYERLISLVEHQRVGPLVINNSYDGGGPLTPPTGFHAVVRRAVAAGIVVVFSAGNNRRVLRDTPPCGPQTIFGVNSLDEVITVGTVDEHNRMDQPPPGRVQLSHRNGSRGPGQFAVTTVKPDCVAPTYGQVMSGCADLPNQVWWGTSGAAPQVAGLAALLLSKNGALKPGEIKDIIKRTCADIRLGPTCAGAGLIDCQAAVAQA